MADAPKKKRERGFYWIKHQYYKNWIVGQYRYPQDRWQIPGDVRYFRDDEMTLIDERLILYPGPSLQDGPDLHF